MWKIHGKYYDLNKFIEFHPGGSLILKQCEGENDMTAAFESYHAMCDMNKIKKIMKKYEIKDKTYVTDFSFNETMFYNKLKKKVKNYFITKKISHHANFFWLIKSFIQVVIYICSFISGCYMVNLPIYLRIFFNFIAGHMFIQYGFTVMHDASHYAVSSNKSINEILANIWNSLALWNNDIWYKHHCIMHHSYTGLTKDPDTLYLNPFIRKSIQEKPSKYIKYNIYMALFITNIFPGMWLGQGIAYFNGIIKKRLWRMTIKYKFHFYEFILSLFTVFSLLYSQNIFIIISYIISCNMTYFICILPDHDTFETHNNIVYDAKNTDWGELQVRNSGNFATSNSWINNCFGGINYQIEHHLFPTISHVHFPEISKIVKKMCEEHSIPYTEHKTVYSALHSVFKNFEAISKNK